MLQSIVLSCYPFHILLLSSIVANHGWTLHQGSIAVEQHQKKWKKYAENPQNFSFSLLYLHWVNMRWVFQLPAEVSFKLAVILAIQLLGLKWEFKVNFMQI